jgi:ribosomal-protein-alanine N-acetyltransferase
MILETDRLYLRHLQQEDAIRMVEYRNKPEVARYQSWEEYSKEDAKKRIQHCQMLKKDDQPCTDYHLAIVKKDDYMIGDLFVEIVNRKIFVLGYTLDSDYWSQGYATEIVESFLQYMKNQYGFQKVICYVYPDNKKSIQLLKRLGFMKFEESYYYNDQGYIKKIR